MRHESNLPMLSIGWFSVLFALLACHGPKGGQLGVTTPGTSPVPSAQCNNSPVGRFGTLKPSVTYRRSAEMIWQDATVNLPLFAFDAIRTHAKAYARILLESGSVLELREESLVIINPAVLGDKRTRDRAIVRHGVLDGSTENELWILTSAALLRIRAAGDKKRARAAVSIQEGKKLSIKLEEGEGTVYHHSPPASAKSALSGKPLVAEKPRPPIQLVPQAAITVDAPVAQEEYGWGEDESNWAEMAEEEPAGSPPDLGEETTAKTALDKKSVAPSAGSASVRYFQPEEYRSGASRLSLKENRAPASLTARPREGLPGLSNVEISAVVKQHLGQIRSCYETTLSRDERWEGKLVVGFTIGGQGTVVNARAKESSGNERLDQCGLEKVKNWAFPKPKDGVEISVSYPFIFKSLSQ